ncbi:sulfotransferase family protein [Cytobacillus firmus]|uniref:sulfotransferase family protein n=1 Tax=Cytobacillus firmus TaxID=1399 RepID=UPI00222835E8|nr:sulfotransferase family protein [Cytobacillus firmus]
MTNKSNETESLLIFLHIPKTGGTTLSTIISNQYKENEFKKTKLQELQKFTEEDLGRLKCIAGHGYFGVHEYFNRSCSYFTMVRDPVDRVLSNYYFIKRRKDHRDHNKLGNVSLKEFVRDFQDRTFNHQTKRLSGPGVPSLEAAKENLERHFTIVGVTDEFDESLFLMKKEFNWSDISYEIKNSTENRPSIAEVPKDIINYIKEMNQLDIALYQWVKKKHQKKIQNLSGKLKKELNHFLQGQKNSN